MKTKAWSLRQAVLLAGLLCLVHPVAAQVFLSANGYEWDISADSGYVSDGGDDAFDGYGELSLRIMDLSLTVLGENTYVGGFNLTLDGRTHYSSTSPQFSGVTVNRTIYAPADQNYLRYYDTFTNTTGAPLILTTVFGGNLGSDSDTTLSRTSSGDTTLTTGDFWAITFENADLNPAGPVQNDPVVGVLFGNTSVLQGFTSEEDIGTVFTNNWVPYVGVTPNVYGDDGLSYRFQFTLQPGQTSALLYFLYRGQAEVNADNPLSLYGSYDDGLLAPGQLDLATTVLSNLSVNPNYDGLSQMQIDQIINFTPVPEPSTWVMMLGGLTGVAVYLRRLRSAEL
jgi:amidase